MSKEFSSRGETLFNFISNSSADNTKVFSLALTEFKTQLLLYFNLKLLTRDLNNNEYSSKYLDSIAHMVGLYDFNSEDQKSIEELITYINNYNNGFKYSIFIQIIDRINNNLGFNIEELEAIKYFANELGIKNIDFDSKRSVDKLIVKMTQQINAGNHICDCKGEDVDSNVLNNMLKDFNINNTKEALRKRGYSDSQIKEALEKNVTYYYMETKEENNDAFNEYCLNVIPELEVVEEEKNDKVPVFFKVLKYRATKIALGVALVTVLVSSLDNCNFHKSPFVISTEKDKDKDKHATPEPTSTPTVGGVTIIPTIIQPTFIDNEEVVVNNPEYEIPYIGSYEGNNLREAFIQNGYLFSAEYCSILAEYFGFVDYQGSADENEDILEHLKEYSKNIDASVDYKNHTHEFGASHSHSNVLEEKNCECGYTKIKTHSYVKNDIEYLSHENGNHDIIKNWVCSCGHHYNEVTPSECHFDEGVVDSYGDTTYTCDECGYKKVLEKACKHRYGKWLCLNDYLEYRECAECGKLETQNHDYILLNQKVIDNDNGTHTIKSKYKCNTCNHIVTINETCNCNYGEPEIDGVNVTLTCDTCGHKYSYIMEHECKFTEWKCSEDGTHEERTCLICGEVETRDHSYESPKILYKSNNNGTHVKTSTSHCSTCGHDHIVIKKSNCSYGATEVTYKDLGNGTHEKQYKKDCKFCGYTDIKKEQENCTYGPWYKIDDLTEERACTSCQHKERQHVHKYTLVSTSSAISNNDGKTHYLIQTYSCPCGDTDERKITYDCTSDGVLYFKTIDNVKYEYNKCSVCGGEMNLKVHTHNPEVLDTTVVCNDDGTHTITKKCKCKTCHEEYEKPLVEVCKSDGQIYYEKIDGKVYEYNKCNVCHGKFNEKLHMHNYDQVVSTSSYVGNGNGTHTASQLVKCKCGETKTIPLTEDCTSDNVIYYETEGNITYEYNKCSECGQKINRIVHSHKMNLKSSSNPTPNNNGTHSIIDYYECACGHTKNETRTINCTPGTQVYYTDDHSSTYHKCTVCQGICGKEDHIHLYGEWTDNGANEKRICACGEVQTRNHNYGPGVLNQEHTKMIYTCTQCGHQYSEEVEHTHDYKDVSKQVLNDGSSNCYVVTRECETCHDVKPQTYGHDMQYDHDEYPSTQTADYCYKRIYSCNNDGCSHETYGETVSHSFVHTENPFFDIYTCSDCGYSYSTMKQMASNLTSSTKTSGIRLTANNINEGLLYSLINSNKNKSMVLDEPVKMKKRGRV